MTNTINPLKLIEINRRRMDYHQFGIKRQNRRSKIVQLFSPDQSSEVFMACHGLPITWRKKHTRRQDLTITIVVTTKKNSDGEPVARRSYCLEWAKKSLTSLPPPRGSSSGVHRSQAAVVRRRAQNAAKPPLKEKGIVDKQLTREFKSFILLDAIPDLRDSMNTYKNVCFDFFAKYHPSSKRCLPIQKRAHRYHEQDNLRKGVPLTSCLMKIVLDLITVSALFRARCRHVIEFPTNISLPFGTCTVVSAPPVVGPEPSPDDVLQPLTGPYRITTMSVYDGAYSTIAIATDDVGRGVSPMRGLTAIVCYAGRILRAIKGGGGPRVNCFREEATWGTTDGREVLYGRQLSRIYESVENFESENLTSGLELANIAICASFQTQKGTYSVSILAIYQKIVLI
ncbi:hypothetical protein GEV33_012343 [Tenebrio molitor]|uniref:Uncharacterized protein n=1 Tax=Tenebrio molitor TaxID=7067 RepID=A0A8J6H9Y0_TENMO|nr:hypothetical protein GEV33_012343 [Tenebrio molitor]